MALQALPMKLDCVASVDGRPEYAWKTEVSDLSHVSAMTSNVSGSAVADTAASNTLRSASACAPHALAIVLKGRCDHGARTDKPALIVLCLPMHITKPATSASATAIAVTFKPSHVKAASATPALTLLLGFYRPTQTSCSAAACTCNMVLTT